MDGHSILWKHKSTLTNDYDVKKFTTASATIEGSGRVFCGITSCLARQNKKNYLFDKIDGGLL